MDVKIWHLSRAQGKGTIVYSIGNGPMIEKNFPSGWTDYEVLESIGYEVKHPEPKENDETVKESEPPKPEEAQKEKVSVNQQMEDRRELKKKYISDLKKIGIDKSKDPSFSRVEAAWKKNFTK